MEAVEDQEAALFHSYQCALYYVQSPSTIISHSNTNHHQLESASRFSTLSRYSSSRGSNNSKIDIINGTSVHDMVVKDVHHFENEDDDEDAASTGWWSYYFSFRNSSSWGWIGMQIGWRFLVSLGVALLVFYLFTKPPTPKFAIKMTGIPQFGLGEGVDGNGIPTNILTCNCTMDLTIHNYSKVFALHITSPLIHMSFAHLPLATSHGPKLYARSYESMSLKLNVGTKNKPMYGAGRSMQDMLESGQGLPLVIRVSVNSSIRVVWDLIKPKFHHQAECLLVLGRAYDQKHRTQSFNTSCIITGS